MKPLKSDIYNVKTQSNFSSTFGFNWNIWINKSCTDIWKKLISY